MAATSGVNMNVRLVGREFAQARLREIGRSVDPVVRGSVNTTATRARRDRYVKPLNGILSNGGGRGARTNLQRIKLKRANTNHSNARLIPSGAGIPVPNYKSWGYDPIDKTRARIWVMGPSGRKVAAGFVNPSSLQQLPWMTRSVKRAKTKTYTYQRSLQTALGLSTAYWFKQLSGTGTIRWVNTFLQQEFERRIRREIAKYSR